MKIEATLDPIPQIVPDWNGNPIDFIGQQLFVLSNTGELTPISYDRQEGVVLVPKEMWERARREAGWDTPR